MAPTAAASGPELSVPRAKLDAALACPATFDHREHEPVLLVHGTAADTTDSWSWNYLMVLPKLGYDVCSVELPDRALGDIQVSSEYVVDAVRSIRAEAHRKVDVIGHSQGTLEPRWAMKWWPDVGRAVDDNVSLAGVGHGVASAEGVCTPSACFAAGWQMVRGSQFLTVLNDGDETPGGDAHTTIFSEADEVVRPWQTSRLAGAANVNLQAICPGRPVGHAQMLGDPVAFRVTVDALSHPGPGDPARAAASDACVETGIAGGGEPVGGNLAVYQHALSAVLGYPSDAAEPPLMPYTQALSPTPASPLSMRLSVRRRMVRAGRMSVFRFRVRAAGAPVTGARIRFAGKRARTDRRGRARIAVRLRSPGLVRAQVHKAGMGRGEALVTVRR